MRRLQAWFIGWLCLGLAVCLPVAAQTQLDKGQLDQLMAPVALYPDSLLSQILMGSTYPDDVAAAAKWSAAHTSESGDQAVKAVEAEPWDPSVKSLVAFPSVMDMMGRQPEWVKSVGDAFLAQPDAVMDSVQRLRVQAQKAGNLKSTPQQTVTSSTTNEKTVVVIQPADPQVVYVPSYNPSVVYGAWAYPSYPPYYYPPSPGSVFGTALVSGIGFGLGVAAVNSMWGGFDWGHGDVDIDVNRYNNVNVNQRIDNARNNNVSWQHNPQNRGNAPYADSASRQRFDSQRQAGLQNRQSGQPRAGQGQGQGARAGGAAAAGNSRDAARDRAAQSFEGRTGQPIAGHNDAGGARGQGGANRGGQGASNRGGEGAANRSGQAAANRGGEGATNRAQNAGGAGAHSGSSGPRSSSSVSTNDRQAAAQRQRADETAARDRARASNSSNALSDAGNGDRMRQQSHRSDMNRGASAGGGHRSSGGGGRAGGGGGGGHFGGRR